MIKDSLQVQKALDIIAIDCEMVQTEVGLELERISIVDYDFNMIMDEFVMPMNKILDYNTRFFFLIDVLF